VAWMVVPLDVELGPSQEEAKAAERKREQDRSPSGR